MAQFFFGGKNQEMVQRKLKRTFHVKYIFIYENRADYETVSRYTIQSERPKKLLTTETGIRCHVDKIRMPGN